MHSARLSARSAGDPGSSRGTGRRGSARFSGMQPVVSRAAANLVEVSSPILSETKQPQPLWHQTLAPAFCLPREHCSGHQEARIAVEAAAAAKAEAERLKQAEADAAHDKQQNSAVVLAKQLGVLPSPVEKARVSLRIFTHRQSVFRSHSFLVGSETGGLTEKLGRIPIQVSHTSGMELKGGVVVS